MYPAAPEQAPPSRPQRSSGPAPGGGARRRAPSGLFEPAQLVRSSAHDLLRRNLLLYGLGGLALPFVGSN